jgi:hypothetical protein
MHRIAFDPALPVVAACPFVAAGRSFASGDAVDWRVLGVSEAVLFDWWRTGQVSHPVAAPAADDVAIRVVNVSPAPSIDVRTPQQRKHRR